MALDFRTTDTPSEDKLRAVDTGLDQPNGAVAPLNEVSPLAAFATDETGAVVGGAVGRTWACAANCCSCKRGYGVLAQITGWPNGIVKFLMHRAEA